MFPDATEHSLFAAPPVERIAIAPRPPLADVGMLIDATTAASWHRGNPRSGSAMPICSITPRAPGS